MERKPRIRLKERIMIRRMVVNQARVGEQERAGEIAGQEIFERQAMMGDVPPAINSLTFPSPPQDSRQKT